MSYILQFRRDSAANWLSVDPVLQEGEPGFESDTRRFKVGDGASVWSALAYGTSTELPTGFTTGDIIRWDAVGGDWDIASEPLVFDEIQFTPKSSSAGPVGTLYFDSDDEHLWVGTTT